MAWNTTKSDSIPKIAVCVPHTGDIHMEWAHKVWGPLVFRSHNWCQLSPFLNRGPPVDISRQVLVEQAIEWDADYVFFIDSDVIPELPEDIMQCLHQLYKRDLPIVSGIYRTKKAGHPWAMWTFKGKDDGFKSIKSWKSDLLEVDVTGLGCCLVKREVFDKIEPPWFRWDMNMAPSEDFYFLLKAKAEGKYKVIVDTTVKCSHLATVKVMPGVIPAYRPPQV